MKKAAQGAPALVADGEAIRPSLTIRAKTTAVAEEDPETFFAAADGAIAAAADAFLDHAREDLAVLRQSFLCALETPEEREDSLRRAYTIAHDLKGQGTSYGFSLMTEVAALLCAALRSPRTEDSAWRRVARAHIEALGLVIEQGIRGDGGALGRRVVERLARLDAACPD